MEQTPEPTRVHGAGSVPVEQIPDENGVYPHRWVMVGYWDVEHQPIFDSFVSGKPMELGPPDTVDGPGCLDCGKHWMTGKTEPCEESDDA